MEVQKQKLNQKMYSKVLHQAKDPFVRTPCPAVLIRGVATGDLPLASKVLTYPEVRKLSLPPAKKLASSSRPSPGSPISEIFFPRGSSVLVPTGKKVKVFSEKLGESVQSPSCSKYGFGLQGTVFGSTPSKQIPEASSNVQGKISVSSYRYPLSEKK